MKDRYRGKAAAAQHREGVDVARRLVFSGGSFAGDDQLAFHFAGAGRAAHRIDVARDDVVTLRAALFLGLLRAVVQPLPAPEQLSERLRPAVVWLVVAQPATAKTARSRTEVKRMREFLPETSSGEGSSDRRRCKVEKRRMRGP